MYPTLKYLIYSVNTNTLKGVIGNNTVIGEELNTILSTMDDNPDRKSIRKHGT